MEYPKLFVTKQMEGKREKVGYKTKQQLLKDQADLYKVLPLENGCTKVCRRVGGNIFQLTITEKGRWEPYVGKCCTCRYEQRKLSLAVSAEHDQFSKVQIPIC